MVPDGKAVITISSEYDCREQGNSKENEFHHDLTNPMSRTIIVII
jgi:hypothetical protein